MFSVQVQFRPYRLNKYKVIDVSQIIKIVSFNMIRALLKLSVSRAYLNKILNFHYNIYLILQGILLSHLMEY